MSAENHISDADELFVVKWLKIVWGGQSDGDSLVGPMRE